MLRALILLLVTFSTQANEDIRNFFSKYVELEKSFNTDIAKLYLDHAVIVITHDVEGRPPITISGTKLKKYIAQLAETVRENNDFNTYSNIKIKEKDNGTFLITASRTSNMRCYTDKSYSMTVLKDANGNIKIIKENSFVPTEKHC